MLALALQRTVFITAVISMVDAAFFLSSKPYTKIRKCDEQIFSLYSDPILDGVLANT